MFNNDKRIVPSGRKHFTGWRWRTRGGEGHFLVDEHKVHGPFRQMGRNNKVHQEKAATKKQPYEILMRCIYWQATITSCSLQGNRVCASPTTTRCSGTCTCAACRHRNTLIHTCVKLWQAKSTGKPQTSRGHWEQHTMCILRIPET